jgi:hypothetical protein
MKANHDENIGFILGCDVMFFLLQRMPHLSNKPLRILELSFGLAFNLTRFEL